MSWVTCCRSRAQVETRSSVLLRECSQAKETEVNSTSMNFELGESNQVMNVVVVGAVPNLPGCRLCLLHTPGPLCSS